MDSLKKKFDSIPYDKIANFPSYQRWIVIGAIQIIIFSAYYFLIHSEKNLNIQTLQSDITNIKMEVGKLKRTAKNLPLLEKEIKQMELQLKKARSRLPNEKEIPKLLTDVSNIGTRAGLDFIAFKPLPEVIDKYYARVPVNMNIRGTFHNMLRFFDQISKMPRIVTISNVKFANPKKSGNDINIETSCTATTFRYIEKTGKKVNSTKN